MKRQPSTCLLWDYKWSLSFSFFMDYDNKGNFATTWVFRQVCTRVHLRSFADQEGRDRHLSWSSQVIHSGLPRSSGSAEITLQTDSFALAIRVTSPSRTSDQANRGIWSDIFPLALPPDQAYGFCENWLSNETQWPSLPTAEVQPCPCTLDQALLDIVRFQPDPDCNMFSQTSLFSRTGNCLYRRDASHCIRLATVGPQGIDNLCCYDTDNNLIDSRVKEGASLQRYHYIGGSRVQPYVTNFYFDVLPFLHCCRYSQNVYQIIGDETSTVTNICPSYFTQRKFSSCRNYDPPRPARTNGDPHITTLDGFRYKQVAKSLDFVMSEVKCRTVNTFNGIGEFTFLKTLTGSFLSQIRFEQFQKDNGDLVDASVCTSFVSQSPNTSAVVEVRLNSIRTADVLVNGDVTDFEESNAFQFEGVSIMQVTCSNNLTKREFIVSFTDIGIAFKAIASSNVLNILPVVGNNSLSGTLRGLLGDFDEDPNNDLRSPTEEVLLPNSTTEEIYDKFGLPWRITENASLFTYEVGKSYNDYQKLSFRPAFEPPTNISPEVQELCGSDEECLFDYAVTGSAQLAAETQQFTVIFNTSVGASYQIKNCEDLPTIYGGVWNATSTIEGSIATFSCYSGYEMEGASNIITCENSTWGDFGDFSCNLIVTASTMVSASLISTTQYVTSALSTEIEEQTSTTSATTEIETENSPTDITADTNSITSTEDTTNITLLSESTTTQFTSTLRATTEGTTEIPTSDLPSSTESSTERSTSDLPFTTESITASFTMDVPSTPESITELSTSNLSSTTESITESSTMDVLSTLDSTTESSTSNLRSTIESITESSTVDVPSTSDNTTESFTLGLHSTTESSTESSTSDSPFTTESITESSTMDVPSTPESITESSTSDLPSTPESITESPTSDLPSTPESITESSTSDLPSTPESITESSTMDVPSPPESITESSTSNLPSTTESITESSSMGVLSTLDSTTESSKSTLSSTSESTTGSSTSTIPITIENTTGSSTSTIPITTENTTGSSTSTIPITTESNIGSFTSTLSSTTESNTESYTSYISSVESTTGSSTSNMSSFTERTNVSSTISSPSTTKSSSSAVPTIKSSTTASSTTNSSSTDYFYSTSTTTEKATKKSTSSSHTTTKTISEVFTSTVSTAIENNDETSRPPNSVVTVNIKPTTSIITTIPPFQKSLQEVDGFLKEHFKYIIIGSVFIVLCTVLGGVFICRRSRIDYEEKAFRGVNVEGPQKHHNFSSAKFSSSQSYSSSSSVVGKLSFCDDYTIYKYENNLNSSEI